RGIAGTKAEPSANWFLIRAPGFEFLLRVRCGTIADGSLSGTTRIQRVDAVSRSPVPAFPLSREVATHEKGHPSPVLPGHRHLWLLRHHLCDRVHEEGHPRRDLFPLPSVLHGAAEVHRCR